MTTRIGRPLWSRFLLGAALLVSATLCVYAGQTKAPAKASTATKKKVATTSKTGSRRKRKPAVRAQAVPTPDRIKEIQSALHREGAYGGEPTGRWDASTSEAMKKYQTDNGFAPTGKIDALSLNKLGLGSETAGKGAPVPAASSLTPAPPVKP
jgi:peptidoglycan hydrolase-like protein with peptidoglycan-binding domain